MRNSKKRNCILKTVQENRIHGTAEEIYTIVKKEIPEISLATVYRNLQQLAEQGIILKLSMQDGGDRFDGCTDEHSHLVCSKCGKVFDIDYQPTVTFSEAAKEKINFTCFSSQLIGNGICSSCS